MRELLILPSTYINVICTSCKFDMISSLICTFDITTDYIDDVDYYDLW